MIVTVREKTPSVAASCFVAPNASLIGDVTIGERASIWYNVVIRGDVEPIVIGQETNVQDGSVIHGTYQKCGTTLGHRVTIGHLVMLHGTTVGDGSLIGMGSILMDMSRIGRHCLVGAGSLVTEGSQFADEMLILGRPAKAVRKLKPEEVQLLERSADNYLAYMKWYVGR
jgi:carbonic anhydrase/acetyltransferase-like protein (isoleucine patch superfamily)